MNPVILVTEQRLQAADGGTGDGYIIPAPYKATFYGSLSLSYTF